MDLEECERLIQSALSENRTSLSLLNGDLEELPKSIGELLQLTHLNLAGNRLKTLPPELARLANLENLNAPRNYFVEVPSVICQLRGLTKLHLGANHLTSIPATIAELKQLRHLLLANNKLQRLPAEVGGLKKLTFLQLANNSIEELPPQISGLTHLRELAVNNNLLRTLPAEIGDLSHLITLRAEANVLESLPATVGKLFRLCSMLLNQNELKRLPEEIGDLKNLRKLSAGANFLETLPDSIGRLRRLASLAVPKNRIHSIPKSIAACSALKELDLRKNHLTHLPSEIQQCHNLQSISLRENKLESIPSDLGSLNRLTYLDLSGNSSLTSPPTEIVAQGTGAVLQYLRAQSKGSRRQWLSKLLVVGEGGVGKSCLLRALRYQPFEHRQSTTHGIDIGTLSFPHPSIQGVTMGLRSWDFGGQEIYHATHQFFLTDKSLFVVVWNARLGFEQGRLYYWLDTIRSLAPTSPVLVVATHIDLRPSDLARSTLKEQYPQIRGFLGVSNLNGDGVSDLRQQIALAATELPLMGQRWPTTWQACAEAIRAKEAKHVSPLELRALMTQFDIDDAGQKVLVRWLHELGDILYFVENPDLNDFVILKPEWVSTYISRVLDSVVVRRNSGIFTRSHMEELWRDLDRGMHEHFLRLMEQFDLSYRTLEDREISIVVELLTLEPPDYRARWEEGKGSGGPRELSMKFQFSSSVPAGIPTWFIARSHRFTTHTQWRHGALLTDGPQKKRLCAGI